MPLCVLKNLERLADVAKFKYSAISAIDILEWISCHEAFDYFPEEEKRDYRDKHFPEDLNRAKELGRRLVEEAKKR